MYSNSEKPLNYSNFSHHENYPNVQYIEQTLNQYTEPILLDLSLSQIQDAVQNKVDKSEKIETTDNVENEEDKVNIINSKNDCKNSSP